MSAATHRSTWGLLLVSVIWGTTFVAVKSALREVPPFYFVGIRFALASLCALPLAFRRRGPGTGAALRAGIPLGLILAAGYATQTLGLETTTPARSAFVTGLNVALVPFWAVLVHRSRPGIWPVVAVLLTLPGLWLLTSPRGSAWNQGDTWTVACAVLYALYIVLMGRTARDHPRGPLLFSQLVVTSLVCLGVAALIERPRIMITPQLCGIFAQTGILATTVTIWLQLRFQPEAGPIRAAVIYATEPVFAAFFSVLFAGEHLAASAWGGGAFILAGMLLSELSTREAAPERS